MTTVTAESLVDIFIEKTCLLPAIVLDGVVGEVCHFLGDDVKVGEIYEHFRTAEFTESIEERSGHAFAKSKGFQNAVLGKKGDPREGYRAFMRHWVAAEMMSKYREQYNKLPASFSNGTPL